MNNTQKWHSQNGRWQQIILPTLTMLFGMQTLRTLLPLLVYVLRDRLFWNAVQVGLLAFAIFLTSFLAAPLRRLLGTHRLLLLAAGGLATLRLAFQLWQGDPLGDLYLVIAATVLFVLFLPAYPAYTRAQETAVSPLPALGILCGLALDTALHGAYLTYDMGWHSDIGTTLLVLALVVGQWFVLGRVTAVSPASAKSDVPLSHGLPLLAWGPFLFLQLIIFQNIAWLATLAGWRYPLAFAWAVASHLLGIAVAVMVLNRGRSHTTVYGMGLLALLVAGAVWQAQVPWLAAIAFAAGQVLSAAALALILTTLGASPGRTGLSRLTVTYGLSALLLVTLSFLYYSSYDILLPFDTNLLPSAAVLIMGLLAMRAGLRVDETAVFLSPRLLWPALALLLSPLYTLITWHPPAPVTGNGYPVRVMTYNLHQGFDPSGHLGIEALAQVIERQQAEIVALQEVSRGWVINGSLDTLTWLSQRLAMPYVYGPTADPFWGNAILSRYPILTAETIPMPPADLLLRRGFTWALIDVGNGQQLNLIGTHLHHPRNGSRARLIQAQAIIDYWQNRPQTILMGDLNAAPGEPEIEALRQSGLIDALESGGVTPGHTHPSFAPSRRIDYIWVSPDLTAVDVTIDPQTASDHLGVAATIVK